MFQKTGFGLLGLLSFGVCTFRRGHVVGGGNSRHFGREHSLLKTRAIMPEESKVTAAACAVADSELPQNYIIEFSGPSGQSRIVVDNQTNWKTVLYDPENDEEISFYFGLVTRKGEDGDLKLAKMCASMEAAGVHHHTYDAKSGADYRMTRIGVTQSRLERFAHASDYISGFDEAAVAAACAAEDIVLENPPTAEGAKWYRPYDKLAAPFDLRHKELYKPLTEGTKLKLCRMMVMGNPNYKGDAKGCGFDMDSLESSVKDNEFCLAIFPTHNYELKDKLEKAWIPLDWPWNLPTDLIKEYFGEEVGFYFKFLAHLTSGMLPMAPFGVGAQIAATALAGSDVKGMPIEALFSVTSLGVYSVILDKWRFLQSEQAHLWYTYGCHNNLPPRPGFDGVVLKNPVTGKLEIEFPESLRLPRARVSLMMSLAAILVLLGTMFGIFAYKSALARSGASEGALMVPSFLNAFQILVFGIVYKSLAEVMTEFENHRTVHEHHTELFKKLAFFYFINNYTALFYIAFIKGGVEGCYEPLHNSEFCGYELSVQVAVVFFVNDFAVRFVNSSVLPWVNRYLATRGAENDSTMKAANMGLIENQFRTLAKYDPTVELVMDYIELYIQWGFLVLFGAACPVVVSFACFTNFVETRTDGIKLLKDYRRVLPFRVDGVGGTLNVFYYTLFIAVPVNAGLIVYSFGSLRFLPETAYVWSFVALIFAMFFALHVLDLIYPELPQRTAIQLERQRVVYERLVLGTDDDDDNQLDLDVSMIGLTVSEVRKKRSDSIEAHKAPMSRTEHKAGEVPLSYKPKEA